MQSSDWVLGITTELGHKNCYSVCRWRVWRSTTVQCSCLLWGGPSSGWAQTPLLQCAGHQADSTGTVRYIQMCVCVHWSNVCVCECMWHVCTYMCVHVCEYVKHCVYTCVFVCVLYMYVCEYVSMCVCEWVGGVCEWEVCVIWGEETGADAIFRKLHTL